MIVLIAQHFAKQGNEEDVAAALREMSAYCNSDAEPGCVMYVVNRSTENPRHFLLYEQYVDEAGYQAHQDSEHFTRLVKQEAIPELLAERERAFYTTIGDDRGGLPG